MLKIKAETVAMFGAQSLAEFELRLIQRLAGDFPDAGKIPLEQMRLFVKEQMTRARQYGFTTEQDFAIYVMAAWVLGRDFDIAYPPPRSVLPSRGYAREEKREWLLHWVYEIFAAGAQAAGLGGQLKPLPE